MQRTFPIILGAGNKYYLSDYAFASSDGRKIYKAPTWTKMLIKRMAHNKFLCPVVVRSLVERICKKKNWDFGFIEQHAFRIDNYLNEGVELINNDNGLGFRTIHKEEIKCYDCHLPMTIRSVLHLLVSGGYHRECSFCGKKILTNYDYNFNSYNCKNVTPNLFEEIKKEHSKCYEIASFFMFPNSKFLSKQKIAHLMNRVKKFRDKNYSQEAMVLLTKEYLSIMSDQKKKEKICKKQKLQQLKNRLLERQQDLGTHYSMRLTPLEMGRQTLQGQGRSQCLQTLP